MKFRISESYIFLLLLIINLFPVFFLTFFPTVDGVAHLYNASLMKEMLLHSESFLHHYFVFNFEAVPNITGHILLSLFMLLFNAVIAEKLIMIILVAVSALCICKACEKNSPENIYLSYLIFPFSYSYALFIGILQFYISPDIAASNIRLLDKAKKKYLIIKSSHLALFITLTYFSHILVFIIEMLAIGIYIIFFHFPINRKTFKSFFNKGIILITAAVLPLFFIVISFEYQPNSSIVFVEHSTLIAWLKNLRPYLTLDVDIKKGEEIFTKSIFYFLMLMFIIGALMSYSKRSFHKTQFLWAFSTLVILLMYFYFPDCFMSGEYISIRLLIIFFIFFILFICTLAVPKWISYGIVGLVMLCNFSLNYYYYKSVSKLNNTAVECFHAAKYIEPTSVVLPLNYLDGQNYYHFSNYIGLEKPVVILENYECDLNWFPLLWNLKNIPTGILGNNDTFMSLCKKWTKNVNEQNKHFDYAFVLGKD